MDADTTIVIPTYNRRDLLGACLDSLKAQSYQGFEVVIVDDGSSEDIQGFVAEAYPEADVVRLPRNGGFAGAANAGLKHAKTPYVMLLNNDMTLEPDAIERLHTAIKSGTADMVAPLVLWRDHPGVVYSCGDFIRTSGRPEAIGFRAPREQFASTVEPFGVSAGAAMYKRTMFGEIGYLDERFVAYFEDSDLCFRARLAGFTAAVVPDAVAYHVGSASLEGRLWWRSRQCFRNHTLLIMKNMPLGLLVRYAPEIGRERMDQLQSVVNAARAELGGWRAIQLVALTALDLLVQLPYAWRQRLRIQRSRKITNDQLHALLTHE